MQDEIPAFNPNRLSKAIDGGQFEIAIAIAFPEFVGQRDDQFFKRAIHLKPPGMRSAAASDRRVDSSFQQHPLTRFFVLRPAPGQFFRVKRFASVVENDPNADEFTVERDVEFFEKVDQRLASLKHKFGVTDQAR